MRNSRRLSTAALILGLGLGLSTTTPSAAETPATEGLCLPDPATLCLRTGQFQIEVEWENFAMDTGTGSVGTVVADETGTFWFVDPELPELYVKVVDGTGVNGHFWVFLASLTDWEYTVTVTDRIAETSQVYTNPLGSFTSIADTMAFPDSPPRANVGGVGPVSEWVLGSGHPGEARGGSPLPPCTPSATTLCLDTRRFQVEVDWVLPGDSGSGETIPLSDHASLFWFFAQDTVELAVKILDGGSQNGNFWFFYGATSNAEYTIQVTDTCTGDSSTYFNPQGALTSDGDFAAFPSSPNCNLFFDGFESGDTGAWTVP